MTQKRIPAESRQLVDKLWGYCTVLRDDGLSYGDYVEQLTFLIFLKMAHERTQPPRSEPSHIPDGYDWPSLLSKDGLELERHYVATLQRLGTEPGLLGLIFRKAQNRVQDPAKLKRLIVDLINPETWARVDADVKGDVYEGLLERNAADTKSGAGQYFTPRPLIQAIVDCVQPRPYETIADPACGTGGFLLVAHDFIANPEDYQLDRDQKLFLRDKAVHGIELVDNVARLCAMNLFLHGVGAASIDADASIEVRDSLLTEPSEHYDVLFANPPFGKKSSMTAVAGNGSNGDLSYARPDFWATTSNKQLNFLQHIRSMLKIGGRAAVVLPDNVLFEGGAGETIRRRLLQECDAHTLLRLPTGIFYAQGVKANVLFFERRAPSVDQAATRELWVYDFRTNKNFTLKTRALARPDLDEFVEAFKPGERHKREESERFKRWTYEQIAERNGFNLDIWADVEDDSFDDPANLPAPEVIAERIIANVTEALEQFAAVAAELGGDSEAEDASTAP